MKKLILMLPVMFMLVGCQGIIELEADDSIESEDMVENSLTKEVQIIDLDSDARPIAIMINNINVAQPYQTGLNEAYMVYEIIAEGGITRLMAIYKDSDTSKVGTIRSSRHYYLDYALENDAIYVHFGYSEQAKQDLYDLDIDNINGLIDDTFYWRDTSLPVATEHTVYSSIKKIEEAMERKNYRNTTTKDNLLNYSVDEIDLSVMDGAQRADTVNIKFSKYQTTEFIYDEVNRNYVKKSNGEIRRDYVTKEIVTVKNIITYQVSNYSIDSYGRQDLKNIGSGEGYYISNGYAVKITWEKKSRSSQTVYKYLDGTELVVNDGNTYIEIQPSSQNLLVASNEEDIQ